MCNNGGIFGLGSNCTWIIAILLILFFCCGSGSDDCCPTPRCGGGCGCGCD